MSLSVPVFPAVKTCWRVGVGWIAPVAPVAPVAPWAPGSPWAPAGPVGPVIPVDPEESLHFYSHTVLQHNLLPKYEL